MGRFGINRDSYGFEIPDIYNNAASAGFSAEYQTVYDSFVVKPAADIANQQDIMVRALVAAGVWAQLDVFYIFANNTRANAVINWINPGTFDAIEVNAPTFLAYRHFVGNGVNQYLRTQYTPSVDTNNLVLDDAGAGCYVTNNIAGVVSSYGCYDGTNYLFLNNRRATNNCNFSVNSAAISSSVAGGIINSNGFWITQRDDAVNQEVYRNSVQEDTEADASNALPGREMWILGYNNNGVLGNASTFQMALFFISSSFDATERINFQNSIETYLDYVGAGVIP